jgi:hypothetical protein
MRLHKDLREFIGLLNSHGVEAVIVGGYALAFHGYPRYTGDIDILVRATAENAARLESAIAAFGFASLGLGANDFLDPGRVIQLGFPPHRIDLLTSITGVGFEEAWAEREPADLDGLPVFFIGRAEFLKNKRATGRAQDLADLERLGGQ